MKIPLTELGMDVEKKELKDCPFCGSNKVQLLNPILDRKYDCISCRGCGMDFNCNEILTSEIIEKWNTRTADNAKSVLVIDEEKAAIEMIPIRYNNQCPFALYSEGHLSKRKLIEIIAKHLSQNAKQFMKIIKL